MHKNLNYNINTTKMKFNRFILILAKIDLRTKITAE